MTRDPAETRDATFDPTKPPFATREGYAVKDFRRVAEGGAVYAGYAKSCERFWKADGQHWLGRRELDLVNVTPAPQPADDAAAESAGGPAGVEDDAAFLERMAVRWKPHKDSNCQGGTDVWRLIGIAYLARLGASRGVSEAEVAAALDGWHGRSDHRFSPSTAENKRMRNALEALEAARATQELR